MGQHGQLLMKRLSVIRSAKYAPFKPFDAHCCHMGTAIKHPVPDRMNDGLTTQMLYSCTRMATVGVKGNVKDKHFHARQHAIARIMQSPVRLSVSLSHGCIIE